MRIVKLALVQFESTMMAVAANVQKGLQFVRDASRQKADLIVFPELFTTGYNMDIIQNRYHDLGEKIDGFTVQTFREAAKKHNINIVIPIALKKQMDGVVYNSAIVIHRNGVIAGDYSKTHLWEDEKYYFRPGDDYPVFDLDFGKIGILICYDAGFPEAARILALNGAELIMSPAAFSLPDKNRWDIYFKSRALENGCFVAGINGVGCDGDLQLFGNNKIVNPRGDVLMEAKLNEEEMQLFEIDLEEVAECRKVIPYLKDLRMDTYGYKALD
ncbi:MAG: Nitrilase/cyanide hydratase and apolipoprotein N-acyltransferase [Bacilli bacterium]|nr:Nitrilase/cyanide hydratase and apolipoprotein N-acyltransferase [Bacilli bacterium]